MYHNGGNCWKTNAEKQQRILKLYKAGYPAKDIAHQFGINKTYVSYLARKHGYHMRNADQKRRRAEQRRLRAAMGV